MPLFSLRGELQIFPLKDTHGKEQWNEHPYSHDKQRIQQPKITAEELFINRTGKSHQRRDIQF